MSDTFDHESDAWEDQQQRDENDDLGASHRVRDPLHFHTYLCLRKDVAHSTPKAMLVNLRNNTIQVWVPRKLIRYKGEKMFLWSPFYRTTHAENIKKAKNKPAPVIPYSLDEASAADQREIQHNNVGELQ